MTKHFNGHRGKITVAALVSVVTVIVIALILDIQQATKTRIVDAQSDTASTTVTVLNIAPQWTVSPEESPASATTTPTNASTSVTWIATATDGNGEPYYLLVCKNALAPTPNVGAQPECNGGSTNRFGVSTSTLSGSQSTATTSALDSYAEKNEWYAWICDANLGNPACNAQYRQGDGGATSSPFHVNHPPTFTEFSDDSPTLPSASTTFYATSSDPDSVGGVDTIRLFVCKSNDFTGTNCGAAGSWATSTFVASNPSTSTEIAVPTQDQNYAAYGYILDEHGFAAYLGVQGTNSVLAVANATPTISSSSISLLDTDDVGPLTLATEFAQTTGFEVRFTVTDNNSCVANASTTNEIGTTFAAVFRSGITQAGCNETSEYNANQCYPIGVATTTWNIVCTQNENCNGPSDYQVQYSCTFPLWYISDPTDAGTEYPSQNWLAAAQAGDNNYATSTLVDAETGTELQSFLAFNLATTGIAYGSLQPGDDTGNLIATTSIEATGNVGVDQNLSGTNMCTTYPSCTNAATNTIPSTEQEYATATPTVYGSGTNLSSTTPTEIEVNVPKSTSTSTATSSPIYWGISIPVALTLSGDYRGQNTFTAVVGEPSDW